MSFVGYEKYCYLDSRNSDMWIFNVYLCSSCSQSNLVCDFNFELPTGANQKLETNLSNKCHGLTNENFYCVWKWGQRLLQINKTACVRVHTRASSYSNRKKGLTEENIIITNHFSAIQPISKGNFFFSIAGFRVLDIDSTTEYFGLTNCIR